MPVSDDVRFLKPLPQIWNDTLLVLAKTIKVGQFALIDASCDLKFFSEGLAVIGVSNTFYMGLVTQQKAAFKQAFLKATGVEVDIELVVDCEIKGGTYTGTLADITAAREEQQQSFVSKPEEVDELFDAEPGINEVPREKPISLPSPIDQIVKPFPVSSIPEASSPTAKAARSTAQASMGRMPANPVPRPSRPPVDLSRTGLNPKYTFSTFVVGSNNRFCHSAALAVAERPGQTYNPLFVYGGVGLGKTHLMQAIGNAILERSPDVQVRYVSCEKFTNDLINSIRDKTTVDFRKRYRNVDVLLIDDIQFIEGKESTQEEFFHTFNSLREAGKQIVLSSDRPPKAFSKLEDRLKSRFEWGLTSDIQAPDYETRLAILRNKCDVDGIRVDDATLNHIATLFTTNIRELEGALIRVKAYANLTGEKVDQLSLHSLLTPAGTPVAKPTLSVEGVIETVAVYYKVEPSMLRGASRSADLTLPRHIAMYLAHELMNLSFPRIGQAFGNRKHTSALYANNKVKELMTADATVASAITQLRRQLGH